MELYVDSAKIEDIERVMEILPITGVTTNPTILSRENQAPWKSLDAIRKLIGDGVQLHTQVVSRKAEDMIGEARLLAERLGKNTFVKVPVSGEGFKAMRRIRALGLSITATAVYTPLQALAAAMSGAEYLAPYVNRTDMIGGDGVRLAGDIQTMMDKQDCGAKVLAASFKNVEQILRVALSGVRCVTVSPDLLLAILKHPLTDRAIEDFTADFEKITAPGETLFTARHE